MSLTTIIRRELEARLKRVRFGFLAGPTSGDEGAHGQISAKPDYLDDAQQGIRRIAPPLLDVFPEVGARVAMLAQDGVPEYLAWVGQLWDENAPSMSAWLRCQACSKGLSQFPQLGKRFPALAGRQGGRTGALI